MFFGPGTILNQSGSQFPSICRIEWSKWMDMAQDMTLECLFAKLSYLIGKGYSQERIKLLFNSSLRGEKPK